MCVSDNCLCAKLSTKDPSSLTDNHEFRPMGKNKKQTLESVKALPWSCGGLASLMLIQDFGSNWTRIF